MLLQKGEKISYAKKVKKKYVPGQKAYSSMARDISPMYKEYLVYFLLNKDGNLIELPNSKNKKIDAFGSHKKELKAYIKENKLNINKERGMKKLIEYYNSL